MNATKMPIWGDEQGVVTGYMCQTDFDYELGNASDGNRVYPSVEALEKQRMCVAKGGCGIVEVVVRAISREEKEKWDEDGSLFACEEGTTCGWMSFVGFYMELGGALNGNVVYPSESKIIKEMVGKYGTVPVEIRLKKVIRETNDEVMVENAVTPEQVKQMREANPDDWC